MPTSDLSFVGLILNVNNLQRDNFVPLDTMAREIGKLTIEEIELDPPKENEVLVRMQAAGVCHSDLHTYRGELRAVPPLVLGHEGAGIVEAKPRAGQSRRELDAESAECQGRQLPSNYRRVRAWMCGRELVDPSAD